MVYSLFWVIPGVWILHADISERCVSSIFVRRVSGKNILPAYTTYEDELTEHSET